MQPDLGTSGKIFNAVNFKLNQGEIAVVTAVNGAGKSVLLKLITNIYPYTGTILKSCQNNEIAYLGHDGFFKQNLSALDNAKLVANIYGFELDISRLISACTAYKIMPTKLSMKLDKFSKGEIKKLALAIYQQPFFKVWVFDEPTVNLDKHALNIFIDSLKFFTQNNGAAIIATHLPELITVATQKIIL